MYPYNIYIYIYVIHVVVDVGHQGLTNKALLVQPSPISQFFYFSYYIIYYIVNSKVTHDYINVHVNSYLRISIISIGAVSIIFPLSDHFSLTSLFMPFTRVLRSVMWGRRGNSLSLLFYFLFFFYVTYVQTSRIPAVCRFENSTRFAYTAKNIAGTVYRVHASCDVNRRTSFPLIL